MYPTVPALRQDLIPPAFEGTTQRCETWAQRLASEPFSADDLLRLTVTLSARWAHGRMASDEATAEIVNLGKMLRGLKSQKHQADEEISRLLAELAAQGEELRAYRAAFGSEDKYLGQRVD